MAAVKVLARGWKVYIRTAPSVYTEIKGLNTLTFDGEKSDADTTSFDTAGWTTHVVATRSMSLSLEGYFLEDPADMSRDAGQSAVETLGEAVGASSLGVFKLASPAGTIKYFQASASVSGIGGGNEDPTGWSAELTVSGQTSAIDTF